MQASKDESVYGLIGRNIEYSFSRNYFNNRFQKEQLSTHQYVNFDIDEITQCEKIFDTPYLKGCNVTVPYKQQIIPYLDELDEGAKQIGAVNCIHLKNEQKIGYNTDVYGFQKSLEKLLLKSDKKALILGTGGASLAVGYCLNKMGIEYQKVSRTAKTNLLTYDELSDQLIEETDLIINCTPLGTSPNISLKPPIPYQAISKKHYLYDLVYNPEISAFLNEGKTRGSRIKNGYEMLILQAERSWQIWNNNR